MKYCVNQAMIGRIVCTPPSCITYISFRSGRAGDTGYENFGLIDWRQNVLPQSGLQIMLGLASPP